MLHHTHLKISVLVCIILAELQQAHAAYEHEYSIDGQEYRFVSAGSIPTNQHPSGIALLPWCPDSVEHNAGVMRANTTAVHAYRAAYDACDMDGAIEATYTLQTGYFSPETGLDAEGRSLYETVEEDTRNILQEYNGLDRLAMLLALFPIATQRVKQDKDSLRAMIQQLYNEREQKRREQAKSWIVWLKNKWNAWRGDDEYDLIRTSPPNSKAQI